MFSLLALAVVAAAGGATVYMLGLPQAFWTVAEKRRPMVQIPVNMRPIAAYSQVQRQDLLDPETGWVRFQELPPAAVAGMPLTGADTRGKKAAGQVVEVKEHDGQLIFVLDTGAQVPHNRTDTLGGAIMNPSAIVGRVLRKNKTAGLGFREDSFFPKGTPAGIAGATPPGMRSVTIAAQKLNGIHSLPQGARIDLMANVPVNDLSSFNQGGSGGIPGASQMLPSKNSGRGQTEPVLLAQEALVLKAVYARAEPASGPSKKPPTQEVALALNPRDVIPLQSAINKDLEIICVAHSMQKSTETKKPVIPTGPTAPVTSRPLLAYNVITGDYFEDAATRQVRMKPVTETQINRLGVVTSLDELLGAVVKHDIPQGSFITHADLLRAPQAKPTAAPPCKKAARSSGLSAAVEAPGKQQYFVSQPAADPAEEPDFVPPLDPPKKPPVAKPPVAKPPVAKPPTSRVPIPHIPAPKPGPAKVSGATIHRVPSASVLTPRGYKSVAIPWNKLYGSEYLQIEDIVDITVSYALKPTTEEKKTEVRGNIVVITEGKRRLNDPTERTSAESLGNRAEPWYAAIGAKVIGPVGFPPPMEAGRFLRDERFKPTGDDADKKKLTGPPILFAIQEKDYEAVVNALATKDALFSVLIHSGDAKAASCLKRIVLAPSALTAFEQVTLSRLEQQHTRRLLTRLVRKDDPAFEGALTAREVRKLVGRRLREDKPRHAFFTSADFYPADGWKRVVLAPAELPAFERVTLLKLEQPDNGRLLTRLVREDDPAFKNALTESAIRPFTGRILRDDKPRHAFFTAADFYPANGWKRIVLAPLELPAYERVTIAQLERPENGRLVTRMVREEDPVFKTALTESKIRPFVGRVLRDQKPAGAFFTEADFFPEFVKPGYTSTLAKDSVVTVTTSGIIEGLDMFRAGDEIAILLRGHTKAPAGVIAHGVNLQRAFTSVILDNARIMRVVAGSHVILKIGKADIARFNAARAKVESAKENASRVQEQTLRASTAAGPVAFTNRDIPPENATGGWRLVAVAKAKEKSPGWWVAAGAGAKEKLLSSSAGGSTGGDVAADIPDYDSLPPLHYLETFKGDRRDTHVFDRSAIGEYYRKAIEPALECIPCGP